MSMIDPSGFLRLADARLSHQAPHTELRSAHEAAIGCSVATR